MRSKHQSVVLRGDISLARNTPHPLDRTQATQCSAIARALAPLRSHISYPPTAADVKAVSDKLDALLAGSL